MINIITEDNSNSYVICPICGKEFKELYRHLQAVHNVSYKELRKQHPDIVLSVYRHPPRPRERDLPSEEYVPIVVEDSYVKCPICGIERKNLGRHIQCTHHMTQQELLELYPGTELTSDSCKAHLKNAANTPEGRKTRSNNLTRVLNDLWKDEDYIERRRIAGSIQMLKNMKDPTYGNARRTEYNGTIYRSGLEAKFAQLFDANNILYEYESILLPYIDDEGKSRTYVVDFLLPELVTIVEIKPSCFVDEIPQGKLDAANASPYNYIILTENDFDLSKLLVN